ncbi:MAG: ABC transporter permease [Xanthobacteraceae bacterium]
MSRILRWRSMWVAMFCAGMLELICRLGLVKPTDLVPPTVMLREMAVALGERSTLIDLVLTLSAVAASVAIGAVLGMAGGLALHALPRLRRACEPFLASYYALPLFALYPVLVVIFGIGPKPIIVTGALYAAMSVLLATLSGLDHIPMVFRKTASIHRLGRLATLRRVLIPASAPDILGGITLAVSYAFVAVIASEFLLAPAGLGHAIADAYTTFRIGRMYGLMLALGLVVILVNSGLRHLRGHVLPAAP